MPVYCAAMNILIIDDDASLRKTLRLALETMNNRVTEASDGAEAEERLGHRMYDVAFLDLRLGREQGLDVLPRSCGSLLVSRS